MPSWLKKPKQRTHPSQPAAALLGGGDARPGSQARSFGYRIGITVARSTATAVTLFFGEPSITRSEYVR